MAKTRESTRKATKTSREAAKARKDRIPGSLYPDNTQALNDALERTFEPTVDPQTRAEEQQELHQDVQQAVEHHSKILKKLLRRGQTSRKDLEAFLRSVIQEQMCQGLSLYGDAQSLIQGLREHSQELRHTVREQRNEVGYLRGQVRIMRNTLTQIFEIATRT